MLSTVLISRQRKPNRLACADLFLCASAAADRSPFHLRRDAHRPPVGLLIFLRMGRVMRGKGTRRGKHPPSAALAHLAPRLKLQRVLQAVLPLPW